MSKIKRIASLLLALVMALALCGTALAEDDAYSITIENSVYGNTYNVYKIFDATTDNDGAFAYTMSTDSPWVDLVTGGSGAALFDVVTVYEAGWSASSDGAEAHIDHYAVAMKSDASDEAVVQFFKGAIQVAEDGTATVDGQKLEADASRDGTGTTLTIPVDDQGYYFISTSTGAMVSITTAAPDAVIIDKNTTPGMLTKEIVLSTGEKVEQEAEATGDVVDFEVTASVPLYDGEDLVTDYEFTDEMSVGLAITLTLGSDFTISEGKYMATDALIDRWVTIGSANDPSISYKLTGPELVGDCSLELVGAQKVDDTTYTFAGFILKFDTFTGTYLEGVTIADIDTGLYPSDATITIDYSAHVTDEAVYDNENSIAMVWHETPFDHPTPNDPVYGGTASAQDDVFVVTLTVDKVDANDETVSLPGAVFELSGDGLNDVVVNTTITYEPIMSKAGYDAALTAGTVLYFKLTDGNYTTVSPYVLDEESPLLKDYDVTENAEAGYAYTAYTRTVTTSTTEVPSEAAHTATGTTDANGSVTFAGLTSGSYTLTEIVAPDGYNLLDKPITFDVTWHAGTNGNDGYFTWTITSDGYDVEDVPVSDGVISITVEDSAGSILPGTGGMGTTIFYVVGAVLVLGAVVVLVTRKRMGAEER